MLKPEDNEWGFDPERFEKSVRDIMEKRKCNRKDIVCCVPKGNSGVFYGIMIKSDPRSPGKTATFLLHSEMEDALSSLGKVRPELERKIGTWQDTKAMARTSMADIIKAGLGTDRSEAAANGVLLKLQRGIRKLDRSLKKMSHQDKMLICGMLAWGLFDEKYFIEPGSNNAIENSSREMKERKG